MASDGDGLVSTRWTLEVLPAQFLSAGGFGFDRTRAAFTGRRRTRWTLGRVHGMEEVRGSIPLSSTKNCRSEACNRPAGIALAAVNVASWLRWLRRGGPLRMMWPPERRAGSRPFRVQLAAPDASHVSRTSELGETETVIMCRACRASVSASAAIRRASGSPLAAASSARARRPSYRASGVPSASAHRCVPRRRSADRARRGHRRQRRLRRMIQTVTRPTCPRRVSRLRSGSRRDRLEVLEDVGQRDRPGDPLRPGHDEVGGARRPCPVLWGVIGPGGCPLGAVFAEGCSDQRYVLA